MSAAGAVRGLLADFATSLAFLTRLPVPASPYRADGLARALKFFPLVGLLVGAAAAGVRLGLARHLPALLASLITLALLVLLTGCLHEDGLADAADAFGGGWTREQILVILKDSRIGSYGATALALSLGLRAGLLAALPSGRVLGCLIAAHVLCRWTALPLSFFLPPARAAHDPAADGQGARLAGRTPRSTLLGGTLFSFALALCALRLRGAVAIAVTVSMTAGSALYYRRRIGGVTGDCFGATNQLAEIGVLLCGVWTL